MALQNVEANITLDLYNHDTTPTTVKAIQLDSQTRYVAATLQSMGAEYGLDSNATVQLIVIRPDKVGVQITGTTFTYGDESALFLGPYAELTQVALAVNGKMRGQFKITSGDQILRTEIFAISTGEALDASTDEWADEYDGYNLEEMSTSIETNTADIATLEVDVNQIKEDFTDMVNSAYVTDSASGAIASFVDGADDVPMKSVKVNIDPVQDLSQGDPSPDNICPISGWDGVKVTRTGKNLLPMEIQSGSYGNGVTITVNPDLSITYNKPNGTNWTTNSLGTFMLQAGTYTLIEDADGAQNARISLKKLPDNTEILNTRYNKRLTFTLTEATQIYADFSRASQATDLVIKFMIFKGNTATASDYEPYTGNTYDISLSDAGTVYGGTLDVVSGELTVDKAIVDLGSLTWTKIGTQNPHWRFYSMYNSAKADGVLISSQYKHISANEQYTGAQGIAIQLSGANTLVMVSDERYSDKASFEAAMNGVELCYELATPITYNLTSTEVKSLLGINNIWSDAGDMDVEYRADTKLYIKRLTDSDTDMIADANITSGQYFMVGNDLYRATVNIASGARILIGTNATKVSLSEALNEINA